MVDGEVGREDFSSLGTGVEWDSVKSNNDCVACNA